MQQDVAVPRIEGGVVDLTATHSHVPKTHDDQAFRLAISGGRDRRRSGDLRFSDTEIRPGPGWSKGFSCPRRALWAARRPALPALAPQDVKGPRRLAPPVGGGSGVGSVGARCPRVGGGASRDGLRCECRLSDAAGVVSLDAAIQAVVVDAVQEALAPYLRRLADPEPPRLQRSGGGACAQHVDEHCAPARRGRRSQSCRTWANGSSFLESPSSGSSRPGRSKPRTLPRPARGSCAGRLVHEPPPSCAGHSLGPSTR